jgi:broad specificity phosphatase PhoE
MNKTSLIIARHGETDYNRQGLLQGRGIDAPLNETGLRQAKSISDYLVNYDANSLVSSSLKRTIQTAEPIGRSKALEVVPEGALDEMDFGDYEGIEYIKVSEELQELQQAWQGGKLDLPIPGGESPLQVFERANTAVMRFIETYRGKHLILILHGRLIRILLSEWLGFGLKNMHKIEHQNGALYHLVYNGRFEPLYLNKTDHLAHDFSGR